MTLVAGVDSSTQSCKVVVQELESGRVVRTGRAGHPDGTEADPAVWWDALARRRHRHAVWHDVGGHDSIQPLCGLADGLAAIGRHGDHRPAIAAQYAAYAGARA